MVKAIAGFILGAILGGTCGYFYMKPYKHPKYEILDCVSEDIRNYRIIEVGTKKYTMQFWWGEHYTTNRLANENMIVVEDIRTVESDYKKVDCYEELQKADAADRDFFKNLGQFE